MKLVDLPFIYQLGADMHKLMGIEYKAGYEARFDILIASLRVQYSVQRLLEEYPALTVSTQPGADLLYAIEQINQWHTDMKATGKPDWDVIDNDVDNKFENVLKKLEALKLF